MITPATASAAVLLAGFGVGMTIAGLSRAPRSAPTRRREAPPAVRLLTGASLPPEARRRRALLLSAATLTGLAIWLVSGWVCAAILFPAAAVVLPALLSPPRSRTDVELLTGLEQWVRGLSGLLVAGAGIEHAIHASVRSASPSIRTPVTALSARLRAQVPTERALRLFADDLDDATGDLVASALILGVRRREGGLASVLEDFAASVADEVRMRQAVEADRAKPRNTARWVTGISLVVITALFLLTDYMTPYQTGWGQVVLVLLLTAYAGALAWMRQLSAGTPTPRFLRTESIA